MSLTPKQEAFAQNVASGMTQADAYRGSYNAEKMKPESVQVNASKLMADAKVRLRVEELRHKRAIHAVQTNSIPIEPNSYSRLLSIFDDEDDLRAWAGYVLSKAAIEAGMLTGNLARPSIGRGGRYATLERAGFKCQACGAKPSPENDVTLDIDHIIPFSLGGSNSQDNLQVLCAACNRSKGNKYGVNHNE